MQDIIVEKPYEFIPPHRGTWWSGLIKGLNLHAIWLRRVQGVVGYECRGLEHLEKSFAEGHGILLTPNHCRYADPLVIGWLAREARCHVYAMASWHLFHQSRFVAWAIHKMGGFSVNREGVDRQAINTAIEVLSEGNRPLIIFPEGAISRTNDHLHVLLDGVTFIARAAAKRRAKRQKDGRVVLHPVALKYLFGGDLQKTAEPVLTEIEHRFSWRPQRHLSLPERVIKIAVTLLSLKEMEYFGTTHSDRLTLRTDRLIDRLLGPIEQRWFGETKEGPVVPRVKAVRMKILPDMVKGLVSEEERAERWAQLADIYLAQQVSCYLPDYLKMLSVDRLLETIERFEEDLTDQVRVHGDLRVIIEVGEAIPVSPKRDRSSGEDPLMVQLEQKLQGMLDELAKESPLFEPSSPSAPFS